MRCDPNPGCRPTCRRLVLSRLPPARTVAPDPVPPLCSEFGRPQQERDGRQVWGGAGGAVAPLLLDPAAPDRPRLPLLAGQRQL
eukprot:3251657-Prymnesium_polylepis.4